MFTVPLKTLAYCARRLPALVLLSASLAWFEKKTSDIHDVGTFSLTVTASYIFCRYFLNGDDYLTVSGICSLWRRRVLRPRMLFFALLCLAHLMSQFLTAMAMLKLQVPFDWWLPLSIVWNLLMLTMFATLWPHSVARDSRYSFAKGLENTEKVALRLAVGATLVMVAVFTCLFAVDFLMLQFLKTDPFEAELVEGTITEFVKLIFLATAAATFCDLYRQIVSAQDLGQPTAN